MEKGLKPFLRHGLEISCLFWSSLGSSWSLEQHLCRKKHWQDLKPREPGWTRARASKQSLTMFSPADAVPKNHG